jgi:hypothetical protein
MSRPSCRSRARGIDPCRENRTVPKSRRNPSLRVIRPPRRSRIRRINRCTIPPATPRTNRNSRSVIPRRPRDKILGRKIRKSTRVKRCHPKVNSATRHHLGFDQHADASTAGVGGGDPRASQAPRSAQHPHRLHPLQPGPPPPRPDVRGVPPVVLIAVNAVLILVSVASLIGLWIGRTGGN